MTFSEIIESTQNSNPEKDEREEKKEKPSEPKKKVSDPTSIIRSMGIKIKFVLPTNFGTEYVLAKKYDEEVIDALIKRLSPRKVKLKGASIFVL